MASYLYLVALWLFFGLTHSLLATEWWKRWMASLLGRYFRYYRLGYSFFAFGLLAFIIFYELRLPPRWLWQPPLYLQAVLSLPALAGLLIMGACIRRYFFYLSGIDVLFRHTTSSIGLVTNGLHRYVRHPLYFGTLLTLWSFFFLFPELGYLITCILATLYTWIGALWEEQKLRREFGDAYVAYQRRVPMLIPFRLWRTSIVHRES